jgi:hypothetical protein
MAVAASGVAAVRLLRDVPAEATAIAPELPGAAAPAQSARAVGQAAPVSSNTSTTERNAALVPSVNRPQPSRAPASAVGLEQELELLDRARAELASGNTTQALKLLNRYQALPHNKSMGSEATLLRIQALARSGRSADAARLATDFVNANPDSPLADRARRFMPSANQEPAAGPAKSGEQP